MSVYIMGPLFGAVLDAIKAACTAEQINIPALSVYTATVPNSNPQFPLIVVRLPADFDSEDWAAAQNFKNGTFKVEVVPVVPLTTDQSVAHPYGDNTTPGALTVVEDVMNAIDNARDAFQASTAAFVDYQITAGRMTQENASVPVVSCVITITFKLRFVAGNR